jgi:hypothetical protein
VSTTCYAMVRGSTLRVTALRPDGALPGSGPVSAAVSRSVIKVVINEVTDGQSNSTMRDEVDLPRVHLAGTDDTVGYTVDLDFLRVDPGMLNLLTGMPLALDESDDVVGFDSRTKLPTASFGLEVWSKLSGVLCADGQKWGYTLFPFLRGGYLTGFAFDNGLVSFRMRSAQTRRASRWNVGPHEFDVMFERLLEPVSGNDSWITGITAVAPPEDSCGIITFEDLLDNGDAADPMPYPLAPVIVDGGGAVSVGPDWIVDGGGA